MEHALIDCTSDISSEEAEIMDQTTITLKRELEMIQSDISHSREVLEQKREFISKLTDKYTSVYSRLLETCQEQCEAQIRNLSKNASDQHFSAKIEQIRKECKRNETTLKQINQLIDTVKTRKNRAEKLLQTLSAYTEKVSDRSTKREIFIEASLIHGITQKYSQELPSKYQETKNNRVTNLKEQIVKEKEDLTALTQLSNEGKEIIISLTEKVEMMKTEIELLNQRIDCSSSFSIFQLSNYSEEIINIKPEEKKAVSGKPTARRVLAPFRNLSKTFY